MNRKDIELLVDGYFQGQYKIERFLGTGGFADVYLVKHWFLNERRAMKINKKSLPINEIDNIFMEARIATLIRHENVISIYDAGIIPVSEDDNEEVLTFDSDNDVDDGEEKFFPYFIMEYVVGGDLDEYFHSFKNQGKMMPVIEVLDIIKQISMGLRVLHNHKPKILHRDIKPQNILIKIEDGKPIIKITDFGLADARDTNKSFSILSIAGTPIYMAPECFGEKFSTMSDIYAVGVIFYLLLTNEYPYDLNSYNKMQIASGEPWRKELKAPSEFNSEISPKLDEIVMNCLKANPKNRYRNSDELLNVINDYMEDDLGVDENTVIYSSEISSSTLVNNFNNIPYSEAGSDDAMESVVSKAFVLAKREGRLKEAVEILEKAIVNDVDVREKYTYRLRLWKDDMPGEKLKVEAFKVYCYDLPNYCLARDLLEEAIAYDSRLNEKYYCYVKLWLLLSKLYENKNLHEAIDSLEDLMKEYAIMNKLYGDVIDILKTCDSARIVEESFKIINEDKWDFNKKIEASRLMEFAVLSDDAFKEKYSVKLSLWKRGLSM